ncbi:MAG: hypothetical protein PHQ96_07585 [Candidatus Omnitrophica bacterium]|nr:hypothetical protein [Candidatus Omnitrophota bacterium]
MNKKQLVVAGIAILILWSASVLYAARSPKAIPDELRKIGFNNKNFISYRKTSGVEYFTFFDWRVERKGATVTFVVENNEVLGSFEGPINATNKAIRPERDRGGDTQWIFEDKHKDVEGEMHRVK